MVTFDADALHRQTVRDATGAKVGKVEAVFADDATDAPAWIAVTLGLFGNRQSLIPLTAAGYDDRGSLQVPYDRETIKRSPRHDTDRDLTAADEAQLRAHYAAPVAADDAAQPADEPAAADDADVPVPADVPVAAEVPVGAPVAVDAPASPGA